MASFSEVSGPGFEKEHTCTIPDLLSRRAEECPDKEAFVLRQLPGSNVERSGITFRDLDTKTTLLAAKLLELGLQPHDRIAVLAPTCLEWLYLDFAAVKAQILVIRIAAELATRASLTDVLSKYNCRAFVVHPGENGEILDKVEELLPGLFDSGSSRTGDSLSNLRFVISMSGPTSRALPAIQDMLCNSAPASFLDRLVRIAKEIKPMDPVTTYCTSGSTGLPKVVVHTHRSLSAFYDGLMEDLNFRDPDTRFFNDRSFTWLGSMTQVPVFSGRTAVYVDTKVTLKMKSYDFIFRVFDEEKITHAFLLPYMISDIIEIAESALLSERICQVRALTAGERISEELIKQASSLMPNLSMEYGCTEVPLMVLFRIHQLPLLGVPYRGLSVKILNNENANVPRGTVGDILVKTVASFSGYLDNKDQTSEAMTKDGWFRTNDVGKITSDGKIQVLGRKIDVISKATRKIYPAVLEQWLKGCDKVRECVVVGVPDPRLFEEVCAFIVPPPGVDVTSDDILSYAREKAFSDPDVSHIPKYVSILEELPRSGLGKIDRKGLRAIAAAKYGQHSNS